jgi:hypothetical protein
MKVELEKYISEVLTSLQIPLNFEVYDCDNDIMPEWTEQIQLTHEFLICSKKTAEIKKLQSFLGKPIFETVDNIYWFEGDRIAEIELTEEEILTETTVQKVEYLKTKTALPAWLDDFIFDHLRAEYAPDFRKFDYNLELTKEDNLKYLGTYFPRSYAESFCIFDNIFQNAVFQNVLSEKQSLNILSIGCGTGGDLIGLLTVIEKYSHSVSEVKIWAIDGNKEALAILEEIIQSFRSQTSKRVELHTIENTFSSIHDINTRHIEDVLFDFILSFKMICEIVSASVGTNNNSYYHFTIKFVPMLSDIGLCLLLDVTTKTEHNYSFNPILMNLQVNQALLELEEYQTLLPLPCSIHEQTCVEQCFTQQVFQVSHKQKANDISKVCYRLIGGVEFVNTLLDYKEDAKYILKKDKEMTEATFCPHSKGEKIIDGYKI